MATQPICRDQFPISINLLARHELFVSSGDIEPNTQTNTLTIRIHRMANPVHDRAIAALLEELNSQEFAHPETGAKMTFALV